jgi:predicted DNA-binding transcriptional regulator YafY
VSYWKAEAIITLATMVAGRHVGVTLDDVEERFSISKRTAQRMLRVLEALFPDTAVAKDSDGRKRWRLAHGALRDLLTLSAEELAALDLAAETMKRSGMDVEAEDLLGLREKVLALVPRPHAARIETDLEALLEAQGLAARPGPRQRIQRSIVAAISEAIKACRMLEVEYRARDETEPRPRRLAPYGLLTGLRRYLVARPEYEPAGPVRLYVVENISAARVGKESFERDPAFDLQARRSRLRRLQNEEEPRRGGLALSAGRGGACPQLPVPPVPAGRGWARRLAIVRFSASGHLEMCWHLYAWGDQVEVLAPQRLRDMVHAWRRSDFPSLP